MRGIIKGLKYIHDMGVYHQHIKPENVWITDSGIVKMGGFELEDDFDEDS